jgi:hypothetical protein
MIVNMEHAVHRTRSVDEIVPSFNDSRHVSPGLNDAAAESCLVVDHVALLTTPDLHALAMLSHAFSAHALNWL